MAVEAKPEKLSLMAQRPAAYCWPQSVLPEESLALFVDVDASYFSVEVLRDGAHPQLVYHRAHVAGHRQTTPDDAAVLGCGDWHAALSIEVDPAWPSGFYLVRILADGEEAEAFFVVRHPAALASEVDGIWVLSSSTWHAYNDWGGASFYTGGHEVSRRRPLPKGFLAKADPATHRIARFQDWTRDEGRAFAAAQYSQWCMAAGWANWERLFACWSDAQGYRWAYALSEDLHEDAHLLDPYRTYVSVGHDEYWSRAMRDQVEAFIAQGGCAAFFSGNTSFWQVRFERHTERLIAFKMSLQADPCYAPSHAPDLSTMWCDPLVGRTEAAMTGVSFSRGGYAHMPNSPQGSGGYEVHRPEHWALAGTGLRKGETLGSDGIVVGYECDGCAMDFSGEYPRATGEDGAPRNLEIVATSAARLWETHQIPGTLRDDYVGELNWVAQRVGGQDDAETRAQFADGHAVLASFARADGEVFTTGCTDWAYGLTQSPATGQSDVDRVTINVVERFIRRDQQRLQTK